MQAAAQEQFAEPMPTPLQIFPRIIARATQVANRLLFQRRWADFRQ